MAAEPSAAPATLPSFVLPANLLKVHLVPSPRSLMKTLNNPWDLALVTGLLAADHSSFESTSTALPYRQLSKTLGHPAKCFFIETTALT